MENTATSPTDFKFPLRVDIRTYPTDHPCSPQADVIDAKGVVVAYCGEVKMGAKHNAEFIVRACNAHNDLRRASQELYDRLNDFLDTHDDGCINEPLEKAMDELEAAWHKADGTVPETNHETNT